MNNDSRAERMAAGLEKRFEQCGAAATNCLAIADNYGGYAPSQLHDSVLFLRTSAQIAGVIARFEALAARENRGSNPQ